MPLLEIVKEVFNLIRSKKIMSEVFPKLGGLPQPVIDKMFCSERYVKSDIE